MTVQMHLQPSYRIRDGPRLDPTPLLASVPPRAELTCEAAAQLKKGFLPCARYLRDADGEELRPDCILTLHLLSLLRRYRCHVERCS